MTDKLQKVKNLIDNGHYEPAIDILNNLNGLSPKDERYRLLLLSYSLYNIRKYNLAITIAETLLQKNSNNEYASQIKYLSCVELKDYDRALDEIISFLSVNKANLYKITLEELLTDIKDGFINNKDISDKIKELALNNNISL
ncbi:hypothetical protein [Chryseobacterium shigense]|uniref:Outer membrane protein assembly factor BamD (BamD/ComL family) n=1 Tax=Chryseobacterium shigense TaxID=297244 RepID=A0A841N8U4_9FLAO|nr:hypothetical protein [Chryseobacterium shigense]MBB6369830.1 outer membrane protein assembly factor BamD (BamD/ComL family) [Chryseobacterium shigense]